MTRFIQKPSFLVLAISFAFAAGTARAADLTCRQLPELFKLYLASHVSIRTLTDELKSRTIDQYLEHLDGSKTMLLQADVDKIRKDLTAVFDTMSTGNCQALEDAEKTAMARAEENADFAKKFLDDKYKLDETVEFVLDSKKRSYPKTVDERQDLLKKFIHFQISNYLVSDTKLPEAKKLLAHRYELITKRIKERKVDELYSNFADSFAMGLDPHSSFFSKDKMEDFKIDMSLSLEGIGASLSSQDGYTVVEEIIPGGAADHSKKLVPKDKIIGVAQGTDPFVSVVDMDLRDVVKLIRGRKDSLVRLSILRTAEASKHVEVTITRAKVDLKEQAAKITYQDRKVNGKKYKFGIIDLPSFYGGDSDSGDDRRSSYADMKRLLEEASAKKVDGMVVNLSRNGGGLLDDAYKIGGLFIKKGPIVATKNSREQVEKLEDKDESISYSGPLVLLTSRVSASASEILAGAMKDYHRALIVGADHTFGKGTVQAVLPLPKDLGAMKVTTGMFFVPGGESTQHQGVAGDVIIPSVLDNDEIGEKTWPNSLPPAHIPPFAGTEANFPSGPFQWKSLDDNMVGQINAKSQERMKKDPKFAEIRKDIEEAKKNKDVIKLAEVKKRSEADKKKNKAEEKKSMAQRIQDADAPFINESLNILTDLVLLEKGAPASVASGTR